MEPNDGFPSIPCLITGGYIQLLYRVTNTECQGSESEHVWFLEFLNINLCRIWDFSILDTLFWWCCSIGRVTTPWDFQENWEFKVYIMWIQRWYGIILNDGDLIFRPVSGGWRLTGILWNRRYWILGQFINSFFWRGITMSISFFVETYLERTSERTKRQGLENLKRKLRRVVDQLELRGPLILHLQRVLGGPSHVTSDQQRCFLGLLSCSNLHAEDTLMKLPEVPLLLGSSEFHRISWFCSLISSFSRSCHDMKVYRPWPQS